MWRASALSFALLILSLAITGCATTSALRETRATAGGMRGIPAPANSVIAAARRVLLDADMSIEEEYADGTTWFIIAKNGSSALSWGEYVRVGVQPVAVNQSVIRIYSKPVLATNVTAKQEFTELYDKIGAKLGVPTIIPP